MAGPIQIGDAIRLAELAWTVWSLGWASENNAGENYKAFGADVRTLHSSLCQLESAIERAQKSLISHGAQNKDILGGDQTSLSEIVGDYKATLKECQKLLWDNRRYDQTTGPARNIDWNINVMPQVDHLRGRIQMHNTRIQHVLKPFEIDLINNFHGDLVQRITSLHVEVLRVNRNIDTLIAQHYPDVAKAIERRLEQELCSVRIPDPLLGRLGGMFERHKLGRPPTLHEMTDCFLIQFERSTVLCPILVNDNRESPPVDQYLALLKCQLVMDRMKDTTELRNSRRMSHWPGYVRALEEKLAQQSSRFETELTAPDVSNCEDKSLEIWHSDDKPTKAPHLTISPVYVDLVEVALAKESSVTAWRTIRVSRRADAEHRFRLVETCSFRDELLVEESRVIDINIRKATLIPIYADPVGKGGTTPPLEIILEDKDNSYRFIFMDLRSLFLFQQAFTGFKVAENFMESRARAVFVRPGKEVSFEEDATLQLWIPSPMKEWSRNNREDDYRRPSSGSQESIPSTHIEAGRQNSVFSCNSNSSAAFSATSYSSIEDPVTARIDERTATTAWGMKRPLPRNPLLIMFTRGHQSRHSLVAITIDDDTKPNPERCNCQKYRDCRITALERRPSSTLRVKRLENCAKWNLLPVISSGNKWEGLLRVSILFPTVEARHKFGGSSCNCRVLTELDVDVCLSDRHQGLLGIVRNYFRRQMVMWHQEKDGQREIDDVKTDTIFAGSPDRRMTR